MDSFTQRMMNRATSRKAEFEQHMNDILTTDDGIDDPNLESLLEAKRREYREILHGCGSRPEVDDKENSSRSSVSETTKSRLTKLGHLYGGEAESGFPSPVGYGRRQAEKELNECEQKAASGLGRYSQQRSKRLAQLATVINNWEDESDKKLQVAPRVEAAAAKPVSKPVSSPALKKKMENFDKTEINRTFTKSTKKVAWDDRVLHSLEMQGFQRCDSDQHLVFDYKSPEKSPANCSKSPGKCEGSNSRGISKKYPAPAPPTMEVKASSKKYPAPAPPMPPSPGNYRSRSISPVKSRSVSPVKSGSASPVKFYNESPVSSGSGSPFRSRSVSPVKSRSVSPTKSASVSPVKSRSVSPVKMSQSPTKHQPGSPTKSAQLAMSLMQDMQPVRRIESDTPKKPQQLSPKKPSGSAVLEMAAKYEHEKSPTRKVRDPTELSIHDRKLIFERNNCGAILPKAPFGMPVPAKALLNDVNRAKSPDRGLISRKVEWKREDVDVDAKDSVSRSILERQKEIEMLRTRWEKKRENNQLQGGPSAQLPPQYRQSPATEASSPPQPPPLPANKIRMGMRSPMRDRSPVSPTRSPLSPTRSPDMSPARSPYMRRGPKAPEPAKPPSQRKSSEWAQSLAQIKKIKVSPPKAGRLYPSVSDIETESEALETESEVHESDFDVPPREARGGYVSDSEESALSFGQAVVRLSQTNLKRGIATSSIKSDSSTSSSSPDTSAQESRILHEMDDFLDEALGDASPPKRPRDNGTAPYQDQCQAKTLQPSGPSGSTHSDSFEYQQREENQEKKLTPLVHTVSTYRKNTAMRLPKNELAAMEMEVDQAIKNETPESALVEERIFELEQEMIKQTTIISQATQALNLCLARPEFVGSMEQVEAEKLLLIATSRRMAALHELERLKVEKTIKPGGMANNDKGSLTIQYISLPIKMCPTEPDKTEHFLCLVTSGVTVQATQVLALKKHNLTRGNRLAFTKPITLESLYCDFTVTIEVYKFSCKNPSSGPAGAASEPKEEKKLSTMLRLTPQKKSTARRNHRMPIESPAGPNSVRSPSFKMVGFVVFSLREVKRNKFTLNKVPYGVPLDGTIELSMSSALKSEVEYRGFLTQFEEVSGFGAWKRKWALLKGSAITFWLYPEHEEHGKIPIDTVDLSTVKNKEIGLVARDICARPHTFLLETDCGERKLLSADTVEDRLAWTKAINKSLQLIRAWGGRAY